MQNRSKSAQGRPDLLPCYGLQAAAERDTRFAMVQEQAGENATDSEVNDLLVVSPPVEPLREEDSEYTGLLLATADFLHHFHSVLGLPAVPLEKLHAMVAADESMPCPTHPSLSELFIKLIEVFEPHSGQTLTCEWTK
jgi:hypothetical protein